MFANLVPTNTPYRVGVSTAAIAGANDHRLTIQIDPRSKGQIKTQDGDLYKFVQDTFHGLTRLIVQKK